MINRIHILGASGSGTSTLAKALSEKTGFEWFDTDNFFWEPTNPPFQRKREVNERKKLLGNQLENAEKWILSGSLCGWGDDFIPMFDLVIYLWIPHEVRMERLEERERSRYGNKIEPEGPMYKDHLVFMDWASQYDKGDMNVRSKALHDNWLSELKCPVLRLEGDMELEGKVNRVLEKIERSNSSY